MVCFVNAEMKGVKGAQPVDYLTFDLRLVFSMEPHCRGIMEQIMRLPQTMGYNSSPWSMTTTLMNPRTVV